MLIQEVKWLRSYRNKLCHSLRSVALEWYRPVPHTPCFLQKSFKSYKQRHRKIPVIILTDPVNIMGCSVSDLALSVGCKVHKELSAINCFTTKVDAKTLEALVKNENVKKVWMDTEVKALLDVGSKTVSANKLWDLNYTGKNSVVAVLDTGVYPHPDLEGRIVAFKDFIGEKKDPYDDNGHGTHVAGAIASNGSKSNGSYVGPAPHAKVVGVKVLNKQGSGSLSGVIEGILWCVENRRSLNINIMNLSLGYSTRDSYKDDPVCSAIEKAWDAGIVVCVAAGNSGPQSRTINSPGIHPKVITVGALDDKRTVDSNDDSVASFSSRGPTYEDLAKPDIIAPGVDIISHRAPNSTTDKQDKESRVGQWYYKMSGTSMATPICAGVVAQILEINPSLKPNDVKRILMQTATPLSGVDKASQGAGVINANNAYGFLNNSHSKRK